MILSDISYKVTKNNIGDLNDWLEEESSKVDAELHDQKLCREFDEEPRCFISTFKIKKKKVVYVTFRGTQSISDFITDIKSSVFNYIYSPVHVIFHVKIRKK